MTVIIKEVVVNTTVNSETTGESRIGSIAESSISQEETINECVEQVMRILKDKNER